MAMEFTQEVRGNSVPLIVIGVALFFFYLVAAIVPAEIGQAWLLGIAIGVCFSQAVAAAVVICLSSFSTLTRVVGGTLWPFLAAVVLAAHTRHARSSIPLILGAVVMSQWFVYQIPLWTYRINGWRLILQVAGPEGEATQAESQSQYGLRQIFVWTTVVAVCLAIVRRFPIAGLNANSSSTDFYLFGLLVAGNSILVLPLIWGAFVRSQLWAWITGAVIWMLVLSPIQLYMISQIIPVLDRELWIFAWLNASQFVTTLVMLLAMRFTGLRLQHHDAQPGSV